MPKSIEIFTGSAIFFHLLKIGKIVPFKTLIIVEAGERYLVDGKDDLAPLEIDQASFNPKEILHSKRRWRIESEEKEGAR